MCLLFANIYSKFLIRFGIKTKKRQSLSQNFECTDSKHPRSAFYSSLGYCDRENYFDCDGMSHDGGPSEHQRMENADRSDE